MTVAVWALGCGADDATPNASYLWCDGLCQAALRCGDQVPENCRNTCASERPGLADISQDGASLLRPCIAELSCSAIFTDDAAWKAEQDACWKQAKLTIVPTPHVRAFCAGYSEAWFECGSWLSTEDCESSFAMWTDAIQDRVAKCTTLPTCDGLDACVASVFENR